MKQTKSILFAAGMLILLPCLLYSQSLPLPEQLSPANNAINQSSNVNLIWKATSGADQYKVAVGTTPIAQGTVVWDTTYSDTSYALQNLAPGQYYWRIKAKHTANPYQASNWSGVWNFTVGSPSSKLATPIQISPAIGAVGQPTIVTLSWQAVSGANQYKVLLGTNPGGTANIASDTSYAGTSFTTPALAAGTYYWSIQAKQLSPYLTSSVSTIRSFTVGGTSLAAPVLSTPSNNSILQVLGTKLTWQSVSGATFYKVKIATDTTMTNIIFTDNSVSSTNRITENLNYNTKYYWTVQAANASVNGQVSSSKTFTTMPDNPNAVTSHPRLLFTESDLPTLQSWTVNNNVVYIALKNALNTAITNYNTKFFPGGQPNPIWPDLGNTTWSGYVTESYAEFFAFWSLIDPVVANRPIHAQRARNLLMYVIDQALLGPAVGVPFRDPNFMTYDRSRVYGEACPLTVDWIYNAKDLNNNDILTTADKAKIRTVFMEWCNNQLTAYNHPTPIGLVNDKQIHVTNRWILNNYYSGHARNLTLMSLSIDAVDDNPLNASIHYSALGNSLRSYIYNVTGAWLYGQYGQYEKPEIVAADYGISANGLGYGSGGLSVEGSLYGESIGWVAQELLALKTAGWADANVIGKQAKLLQSDYWTRLLDGMLHIISPIPYLPSNATYYGQIYQVANYGDLLRTWVTPEMIDIMAPIGLIDMRLGNNQTRLDKSRWYTRNVLQGGSGLLAQRISNIWPSSYATSAIYYFMLLPPVNSNPPDPRPAMEKTFYDPAFNKILSRTEWTNNCSWFNWQCHWTTINHQSGDGNQFEFFRKGEWLTKERSGYTNDGIGYTSEFHNTLGLQNTTPANPQWYETPTIERGGQWTQGVNAGDPSVLTSFGADYVYATGDATNLYNRPNQFNPLNAAIDIEYAVRSIVWLKPDHIVVYDRAKSKSLNKFKRFFLQFTAPAIVSVKKATVTTPGGQKLYLSNLLPSGSVLTPTVSENLNSLAEQEFTTHQIKIEDPSNPQDIRFLNVLQGADGNTAQDPALLVQSSAGNEFEGVVVKNIVVMFPKFWGVNVSSTTYTVPGNVTEQIITGLSPDGGYDVTFTPDGINVMVTISTGSQLHADTGGVLILGIGVSALEDTSIHNNKEDPFTNFGSMQIIPNPFDGQTQIRYELKEPSIVTLEVFDLLGKKVESILSNEGQSAGMHIANYSAQKLPNGIYICKLQAGNICLSQKKMMKQ